jgi:tetratricopeptide (TPR) repeat protein
MTRLVLGICLALQVAIAQQKGELQQALSLIEVNRLPEAVHKLLAVYGERPDDPDVLFYLGESCGKLMQQSFNRLLRLHPDSPRAQELRARAAQGRQPGGPADGRALEKLLAEFGAHPDDPELLFQLGESSGKLMQQAFHRLTAFHPDSARAHELQAQTWLGQGRGALAEPEFRKALKMNPNLPGVHLALGRILLEERGDLDGAEQEFRAEAQLRPGDGEAAWRLGSVLLKKGQGRDALVELQQSDKLKPDMLETLLDLGKAYATENQLAQAENTFRRILAIEDTGELAAAAHLQLSQICRKLGKTAEAGQHLKRFRELNQPKER